MRRPQKISPIQVQTLSELPSRITKETMEKDQIFCLYLREQFLKVERAFLFCQCMILHSKQNGPVFFLVFNFLFFFFLLPISTLISLTRCLSFISIFPVSPVTDSYLSQLSLLQILENSVGATWVEWNLEKKRVYEHSLRSWRYLGRCGIDAVVGEQILTEMHLTNNATLPGTVHPQLKVKNK